MTIKVTDEAVERALKTWFDDEYPPSTLADKEWLSDMRRVLEQFAASAPVAPQGEWVMVPREPTEAMVKAGDALVDGPMAPSCIRVFRAMLAASPPPVDAVMVPKAALDWLNGEGPDDQGHWFGDSQPSPAKGIYWWRAVFFRMIRARSEP